MAALHLTETQEHNSEIPNNVLSSQSIPLMLLWELTDVPVLADSAQYGDAGSACRRDALWVITYKG